MAVTYNLRGTTSTSFGIGKSGPTIYQGTGAPSGGTGDNGDVYLRNDGSTPEFYQKKAGTWETYSLTNDVVLKDVATTMTAALTLSGDPTSNLHAVTKQYVDATATGLDLKQSARVATTANITLSGTQTIDGVTLSSDDRVLVKDQSTLTENGIYDVAAGAWSRSGDVDNTPGAEFGPGAFTFVEEGTTNENSGWTANGVATGAGALEGYFDLGSDDISWTQFSKAGDITAGTNLNKSGNTLNLDTTVSNIIVEASDGSAGTPSISFANDTDTGIFLNTGGNVGITSGGTQIVNFNGGQSSFQNGGSGFPGVSFIADTDTGMYRKSANVLAFSTDGAERLSIDSIGTIIGPSGTWDVDGFDIASADTYKINGTSVLSATTLGSAVVNSSLTGLGTITSLVATSADINGGTIDGAAIGGASASTGAFTTITSTGDVGIGESSPDSRLHVTGSGVKLVLENQNTNKWSIGQSVVVDEFTIRDETAGLNRFHIDDAGNVGIGTIQPEAGLDLFTGLNGSFSRFRIEHSDSAGGIAGGAKIAGYGSNGAIVEIANIDFALTNGSVGNETGDIIFRTALNGAAPVEHMRLTSAGELLVGKTSLQTAGAVLQVANLDGDGQLYLGNPAGTGYVLGRDNVSTGDFVFGQVSNDADTTVTEAFRVLTSDRSLSVTSGKIKFPATQSASSDANTLDDYEEETFTPVIYGQTVAGTNTYSVQAGSYTKIGNHVTAHIDVNLATLDGAMSGIIAISGLPFNAKSGIIQSGSVGYFTGMASSKVWLGCYINASTADIIVSKIDTGSTGSTQLLDTDLTGTTRLILTISYLT